MDDENEITITYTLGVYNHDAKMLMLYEEMPTEDHREPDALIGVEALAEMPVDQLRHLINGLTADGPDRSDLRQMVTDLILVMPADRVTGLLPADPK